MCDNYDREIDDFIREVREKNPILRREECTGFRMLMGFSTNRDLPHNLKSILKLIWPVIRDNEEGIKKLKSNLSTHENSIEYFHEMIVGSILLDQFGDRYNISYSPRINGSYTPDWMIETEDKKLIVEVVTLNHSKKELILKAIKFLVNDMVKRKLGHDDFKINPTAFEIEYNRKDDYYYENQAKDVVSRILSEADSSKTIIPNFDEKEPLIVMKRMHMFSKQLTTTGYESFRPLNSIIGKANKYKSFKKPYYLIVAFVMQCYGDSKIFYPDKLIELIEEPCSVYNPEYYRILDKERHVEEMEKNIEGLKSIYGLMFIETNKYHNYEKVPPLNDINPYYFNNRLYDGQHDASDFLSKYPLFTDKREKRELCS